MKTKIVIWLLLGIATNAYSQKKHDYNWLFGYGTGIPDSSSPFGGVIMSFNDGQISFIPQAREFEFNIQTNSYSNAEGELQLMSNGCSLSDERATVLLNGDSIGFGKAWGINCPKYQPLFQAGAFLNFNKVDSDTIVFVHTILDTIGNGLKYYLKCIYETKIDLKTKHVLLMNNIILYDTLYGYFLLVSQPY